MRISVDQRDRGFRTYQEWGGRASGARVFLGGVEMKGCITADEELGEVKVYSQDADGRFISVGGEWPTEWRRGKVEIVMPGREAA